MNTSYKIEKYYPRTTRRDEDFWDLYDVYAGTTPMAELLNMLAIFRRDNPDGQYRLLRREEIVIA